MPLEVSNWNQERVEKLKDLWAKGLSCSMIAHEIGGTTRNAVIGKVARLGLPPRQLLKRVKYKRKYRVEDERSVPKVHVKAKTIWNIATRPLPDPDQFDRERLASTGCVTLLDLEPHHCRYPVGSTDLTNHRFCGLQQHSGLPYCEHHARVAFQPVTAVRPFRRGETRLLAGATTTAAAAQEFLEPA